MPVINLLGNLNSKGGGEQSLCTLARTFVGAGWEVGLYPWGSVHENYRGNGLPIRDGRPPKGEPLLFYANDRGGEFCEKGQEFVDRCSDLFIAINYVNQPIPKCEWLANEPKLRAIIFQNVEKREEFDRDACGFGSVRRVTLHGSIDLDHFLGAEIKRRDKEDDLVVLKHCLADGRKFVTRESEKKGQKIHLKGRRSCQRKSYC